MAQDYTCGEVSMEKGTLLKLSGARGVYPTSADNDAFAGVLARETIAGSGRTQAAVYEKGCGAVFDMYCDAVGPAIAAGNDVCISGANIIKKYTTLDDEAGYVVGKALEPNTAVGYMQVQI